jgi:flagellar FliL protein
MAAQPQAPTAAKQGKPGDAKAPADRKAEKPPRSKKLLLISLIVLLLAGGGGGAAYVFMSGEDSAENGEAATAPEQPSIFVPLETFTVNLMPTEGIQQYLQTSLTLKLTSQTTADTVKMRMPELRNRILMILSAKRAAELLPAAGKQTLASEIGDAVHGMTERPRTAAPTAVAEAKAAAVEQATSANGAEPRSRPVEVLFTAFIIQ